MVGTYQETSLWKNSLGSNVHENYSKELTRLNSSFEDFRQRAAQLTSQIHSALPSLTIHDISHLDALWETASLLAGKSYPLNPLEGYVLGGAFLLHDSALCFEAYEGGQLGVRNTSQWQDSYALQRERIPTISEDELVSYSDFSALRMLHAHQAEKLGEKKWTNANGDIFYLINDDTLRAKFGKLIGKIAASHHWPIEKVVRELPSQVNAPSQFPNDWRVDAVKIACLLRCADASHIDDRRAPDFLNALLLRAGVSAEHWKAQNWLARMDIFQYDPKNETAIFTSTRAFQISDVKAWWVAYDAISLVEKELVASNTVLSEGEYKSNPIPFQVKKVLGADDPKALSKYIEAEGWEPSPTRIYVGNLEKVIKNLGGEKLYGDSDQLTVVIRELLQNARDAIVARQSIDSDFSGKIRILTRKAEGKVFLEVSDNGIGMSRRVLTGTLLDFGTSFWASDMLLEEFPGLKSKKFNAVGRFGIGFYSIFMVARSAVVSTRPLYSGLQDVLTLNFEEGLTLRPTLSNELPDGFSNQIWTRVRLELKEEFSEVELINYKIHSVPQHEFTVSFGEYIKNIACGLDVCVEYCGIGSEVYSLIHSPVSRFKTDGGAKSWLANILLVNEFKVGDEVERKEKLNFYEKNLRPLIVDGKYRGLATISLELQNNNFYNIPTVGGLATNVQNRGGLGYVGWLDYEPASAKREANFMCWKNNPLYKKWIDDQKSLLRNLNLDPLKLCIATSNIANMGGDILDVFYIYCFYGDRLNFIDLNQLLEYLKTVGFACFKMRDLDVVNTHHNLQQYNNYPTFMPILGGLVSLKYENGKAEDANSLLGCLERITNENGMKLHIEEYKDVGTSFVGPLDALVLRATSL